jgi:hypothetical protein
LSRPIRSVSDSPRLISFRMMAVCIDFGCGPAPSLTRSLSPYPRRCGRPIRNERIAADHRDRPHSQIRGRTREDRGRSGVAIAKQLAPRRGRRSGQANDQTGRIPTVLPTGNWECAAKQKAPRSW